MALYSYGTNDTMQAVVLAMTTLTLASLIFTYSVTRSRALVVFFRTAPAILLGMAALNTNMP